MDPSDVKVEYVQVQPIKMQPSTADDPASEHQQSSVVILNPSNEQPPPLVESYVGYIILSCFAFWCCGAAFGLAAFILAGKYLKLLRLRVVLIFLKIIY